MTADNTRAAYWERLRRAEDCGIDRRTEHERIRDGMEGRRKEIARLRRKLEEIHAITQDNLPAYQALDNIAATAASALSRPVRPVSETIGQS